MDIKLKVNTVKDVNVSVCVRERGADTHTPRQTDSKWEKTAI